MDTPTQEELKRQKQAIILQDREEIEADKKREEGKHYCTYKQYKTAVKEYDTEKDFSPSLLCGCACPEGSISIIAARPAL
jgi:hypothetical protein